jgi:hypothetical protein
MDSMSAPVGMVPLPAMKATNYDGRSHNPSPTGPINIAASTDSNVFRTVPNVIVGRVGHIPGWRRDRRDRWRWACLHRYRRWRRIAPRTAEECYHDKKPIQCCLFHLFPPSLTNIKSLLVARRQSNQSGGQPTSNHAESSLRAELRLAADGFVPYEGGEMIKRRFRSGIPTSPRDSSVSQACEPRRTNLARVRSS